jgi:hypothetical protein
MFWTGIVIGLFVGASFGFILSSVFFIKIGSSTEGKLSNGNLEELLGRDIRLSDQSLLRYLASEETVRFDKTPN